MSGGEERRAGVSPAEQAAKASAWAKHRAEQAAKEQRLDRALAHVFGFDDKTRTEDQRLVWAWLTRETYCICPTPAELPIFEGRRQKGVEAMVALERDAARQG